VGDHVYLKNNTEIMKGVVIGDGCRVAGVLADNSVVGNRVSTFGVLTHKYSRYLAPRQPDDVVESEQVEAPTLKDGAIVGRGAIILGPRVVNENAVVGANSVVTVDVPPNGRVLGPIGVIR
jgi:acetyltransferase-like isoleucine patch superfamily enzyme